MTTSFQSRLGFAPEEGIKAPVKVASIVNVTLTGAMVTGTGVEHTKGCM